MILKRYQTDTLNVIKAYFDALDTKTIRRSPNRRLTW